MNEPNPQWRREAIVPPDHIRYAHSRGRGMLTFRQIEELVKAINEKYTARKQGKMTYLAQHQARAEMNRIFGYGNWDVRAGEPVLMYEYQAPGTGNKANTMYWYVGYRISVTVEIRDLWGMPVASYTGVHAEENAPQPNRGEAHALALTSVDSYALRRALINLGDRFGLGLYDGGSTALHGQYTHQLEPGELFPWVPVGEQPAAAPAPSQPSHETIQAQQAVLDEDYAAQLALQHAEGGQQQQQQQQQVQAPQQQGFPQAQSVPQQGMQPQMPGPTQNMEQFNQIQQQMQADRRAGQGMSPEMQQRLQQGLKTDGGQG